MWACTSFVSVILRILTFYFLLFVWGGRGTQGPAQQGGRKHLTPLATQSSSPV